MWWILPSTRVEVRVAGKVACRFTSPLGCGTRLRPWCGTRPQDRRGWLSPPEQGAPHLTGTLCTQMAHTGSAFCDLRFRWLVRFAPAENGYKSCYRNRERNGYKSARCFFKTDRRHTQVRCAPLWAGLPPRRRLTSHRAQLPLCTTPAALRTRVVPHTIRTHHICTSAPATHPCAIASSSSVRQVDHARTTVCDACPPRDDALRSRWLGAALGQQDLVPLVERVGDHGRSRRRTRSAAAGLESLELVQRGL